jgi:hypothetical protein
MIEEQIGPCRSCWRPVVVATPNRLEGHPERANAARLTPVETTVAGAQAAMIAADWRIPVEQF